MSTGPRARCFFLDGESLTIRQWAKRFKVPHKRVAVRVSKGWSIRDALTRPVVQHGGPRNGARAREREMQREARVDRALAEERSRPRSLPATKHVTEPSLSVADQRIEDAIRELRAQVIMRAR